MWQALLVDCWCVCLCYLHFAPENPEDGEMYILVPSHPGCPRQSPERFKMVVCVCGCGPVLYLRLMPVMHMHQLALCESEKEGSLCEVEAPPCWYSLSLSRLTCYLHKVPLVTQQGLPLL